MAQDGDNQANTTPQKPKNRGGRPKKLRTDPGLVAAIAAAGSLGGLASIVGVTTGAVSVWARVPAKAVDAISARLHIPRTTLRPDLFAADDQPITKT